MTEIEKLKSELELLARNPPSHGWSIHMTGQWVIAMCKLQIAVTELLLKDKQ